LRNAAAIAGLLVLPACQQLPKGLPYSVTDDCRVQRVASAPSAPIRIAAVDGRTGVDVPVRDIGNAILASNVERPSGGGSRGESRRGGGGGGFGFGFGFNLGLPAMAAAPEPDAADLLTQSGPQFPATFSMSCAPVQGFVKGGWPVVIDYQPDGRSDVLLEIHTVSASQPYVIALESLSGRRLRKVELPASLGDSPQVGLFLVRATKTADKSAGRVQLFGLGAGPRAVGSVAIDQVDFRPGSMRVSQGQRATYSFYARSDFNRGAVEILRVQRNADEIRVSLARSNPLDSGINRGTWVGKKEPMTWDGMDANSRVSNGPHLLQVRAWLNSQDARDWVAAWSPSTVIVSE
jgi:hypothetical protein